MANIAIVPIGGLGSRFKNKKPKQFIKINNKSLYLYTIEKLQNNSNVDKIVIACLSEYRDIVKKECEKNSITKIFKIVSGGKTQIESIYNGFNSIKDDINNDDKILIHVGNRPNVSDKLIDNCLKKYDDIGPVSTAISSIEVMINKKDKKIINRNNIIRIQTPQVYSKLDLEKLSSIIKENYSNGSTICDLMLFNGMDVNFIEGDILNFKITYPEDLYLFECMLNSDKK